MSDELFASARAAHPQARLILLIDLRPGFERQVMLAVPESSAWHTLLPPEQTCEISAKEPEMAEDACNLLQAVACEPGTTMTVGDAPTPRS
jgi:hypothetical protein